jgi:very-short-patch-repair endonuclease
LRFNLTEAEQRLWYHLRAPRFMGLKFKRQKPIGPFVADFICLELGLVIEVDGGQHGGASDARRDAWFKANGYHVLRFWNNDVLIQTEVVLESIRQAVIALSRKRERGETLDENVLLLMDEQIYFFWYGGRDVGREMNDPTQPMDRKQEKACVVAASYPIHPLSRLRERGRGEGKLVEWCVMS